MILEKRAGIEEIPCQSIVSAIGNQVRRQRTGYSRQRGANFVERGNQLHSRSPARAITVTSQWRLLRSSGERSPRDVFIVNRYVLGFDEVNWPQRTQYVAFIDRLNLSGHDKSILSRSPLITTKSKGRRRFRACGPFGCCLRSVLQACGRPVGPGGIGVDAVRTDGFLTGGSDIFRSGSLQQVLCPADFVGAVAVH